jgi:alpha-L-arabinofuranosidase
VSSAFFDSRALIETALGRPALVGFGEEALVLAWTAAESGRVCVARSRDGRNFVGNAVLPDASIDGPALAYGGGHIYLAWTDPECRINLRAARDDTPVIGLPGVSNTPQIFGDDPMGTRDPLPRMRWPGNAAAQCYADKRSRCVPALAWGAGVLYLAWVDDGRDRRLNIAMSTEALRYDARRRRLPRWSGRALHESSDTAPTLAFIDDTLYLLWRDRGGLAILPLSPRLRPGAKIAVAEPSDGAPSLIKAGERFHLFWASGELRVLSGRDPARLGDRRSLGAAAAAPPAAAVYGGRIRLAWTAADLQRHVTIASLPAIGERIRVEAPAADAPVIDPKQYGQFLEYLCDLVPGMWADKLCDGGFSGLSQYQWTYRWASDDRQYPWYPIGDLAAARFERLVPSGLRIANDGDGEAGVAQDGIALTPAQPCIFRCMIEGSSRVRVALRAGGRVLWQHLVAPSPAAERVELALAVAEPTGDATLEIALAGRGEMVLQVASLMPEDAVGGWRHDAVAALRAARPAVIRFGGSALVGIDSDGIGRGDFRWHDTIGPVEERRPLRAWGGLQPLGAGLEEFVALCRAVDAEPLICVRYGIALDDAREMAAEAAREVEYFNSGPDTAGGRERAGNGHPEPWGVRYWQIGNEQRFYANGAGGPAGADADSFLTIARAMREADPSIRILASEIDPDSYPEFLAQVHGYLDYVCPHLYLADLEEAERQLLFHIEQIRDTELRVAVTEWNTTGGDEGPARIGLLNLENGLRVARYHHLFHRYARWVAIANRSNLCNSMGSGMLQTKARGFYKTPAYHVQALLAGHAGRRALAVSPARHDDALDLDATLAEDGAVAVSVVNGQPVEVACTIDLGVFGAPRAARAWTIADRDHALDLQAVNDFADPERIAARPLPIDAAAPEVAVTLPALSHTLLLFRYA